MKQRLHLAPLLLGLAACQSTPSTPAATAATSPKAARSAPSQAAPANPEHIEASMVTVSGLPDEEVTTQQLVHQLGRPDSIAQGVVECGNRLTAPVDGPAGDFWYYGKTMYEVSGTQALLSSFEVTSGKYQGRIGKLVLDKNTTLEDAPLLSGVGQRGQPTRRLRPPRGSGKAAVL